jgi:phenylacetate-CoA ligase
VSQSPDQRGAEVLALAQHYSGLAGIPKEEMDALAVQALLKILSVAKQHSPYWNRVLKAVSTSGTTPQQVLRSLPQLSRSDIQRNWDDMQIRIQGPESDYVILKTSGSTGQPIQISKYRPEYSKLIDAFAVMEFVWFKRKLEWKFGAFRLHVKDSDAIRLGPPIEYLGEAAMAFQRESTQHTPTEFLDALEQHQPDYLLTNPVTLKLVAQEQIKQKRPLKPMQQVLTLADRVDDELRELVREVFGAKIVDRYSSVEFNMIAMQCPFENHLHDSFLFLHFKTLRCHSFDISKVTLRNGVNRVPTGFIGPLSSKFMVVFALLRRVKMANRDSSRSSAQISC